MKKITALGLVLCLAILSCKNVEKERPTSQKPPEVPEKRSATEQTTVADAPIKMNLIHATSEKYIVTVDRLANDTIRYTAWNRPKTVEDNPDLVLYNGTIDKQGTGGGYHFIFKNGDWRYTVENNLMGETMESMGVFLKLEQNGQEKLYTKMTDLKGN
ncbi:MAG: hypothetical protein V7724_10995 [Sediminicola sp.]